MKEYLPHISTQDLEKLVKDYPFCAGYKVLLATRLADQPNYIFKKALQSAAVYTHDRGLLFTLINEPHKLNFGITEPIVEETKEAFVEEISNEGTVENPESPQVENISKPEFSDDEQNEELTLEIEPQPEVELITDVADKQEVTQDESEKFLPVSEENEQDIKTKIDFDEVVTYNPIEELKPFPKTEVKKRESPIYAGYDPEKELAKLTEKPKKVATEGNSFLDWLNAVQDQKESIPEEIVTTDVTKKQSNVDDVQSVLDKFLATKRSRPLNKAEFYKPENKAEQSATEDFSIVTETLAEIYKKQGLYELAIKVYKKLMLQNPNKKDNFAAQIKELEKLIK